MKMSKILTPKEFLEIVQIEELITSIIHSETSNESGYCCDAALVNTIKYLRIALNPEFLKMLDDIYEKNKNVLYKANPLYRVADECGCMITQLSSLMEECTRLQKDYNDNQPLSINSIDLIRENLNKTVKQLEQLRSVGYEPPGRDTDEHG